MKLKFFLQNDDMINMNHELIDTLIELSNKDPESEVQFAIQHVASLVEIYMRRMEEKGTPISRETLLEAFKTGLENYRKIEELEKNSKTA